MQGSTCLSLWVENIGKPPPSRFPDSWFVFGKQSPGLIMLSHIRLCSLFKLNCTFNMCACAKIMKALRTSRRCLRTAAEKAELPPEPMKYLGSSAHNMHLADLALLQSLKVLVCDNMSQLKHWQHALRLYYHPLSCLPVIDCHSELLILSILKSCPKSTCKRSGLSLLHPSIFNRPNPSLLLPLIFQAETDRSQGTQLWSTTVIPPAPLHLDVGALHRVEVAFKNGGWNRWKLNATSIGEFAPVRTVILREIQRLKSKKLHQQLSKKGPRVRNLTTLRWYCMHKITSSLIQIWLAVLRAVHLTISIHGHSAAKSEDLGLKTTFIFQSPSSGMLARQPCRYSIIEIFILPCPQIGVCQWDSIRFFSISLQWYVLLQISRKLSTKSHTARPPWQGIAARSGSLTTRAVFEESDFMACCIAILEMRKEIANSSETCPLRIAWNEIHNLVMFPATLSNIPDYTLAFPQRACNEDLLELFPFANRQLIWFHTLFYSG